jgi:predicted nucleic acid-binding protein
MARYCWDTSVFIAYLNREKSAPLADIELVVEEIRKKTSTLLVSVVTYAEVLEAKHTKRQMDAFSQFLKRSNVVTVDASIGIAQKAAEIRSKGLKFPKRGQKLGISTTDATIMATALMRHADVLHSLEPQHINLSGNPIVFGLKIAKPGPLSGARAFPGLDG